MVDELVNPYIAGAPVTEVRMFFGREDVFQWIENSIAGQYADHILVIHGQRRVGKTSVLKQLGNRLPKRYIPVFFDLQGRTHTTLDRFLWWLAREIVRVLKQERGIEIPLPEKEAFSADLEYFENHFLPGLHSSLAGNTLLLTFDEFDNLEESEIKEILGRPLIDYLRRMMGSKDLNFIFSIGSSGRKLENMQASYTDFFKTALYKKISFLNEEQTQKLITQPVDGILEYDRPATNRIFRIAGGHPYFTQLTCHELFARCQRTDQRHIREADVEAILDDVVERGTVNLKFVWDEASDIEKWALASLASLDKSDNRTLAAYLRKQNVRFSESDLTSSLLHLREKDILTPENRFVIHLLRLWLQKNRPIEQVREELTEVNPIANRYIEIGLEFKNSRQYEKAIESFQEALTVSAGNIQAQVSIALVYMDQKAYDKAVGEFEKALAIDDEDVTARSGLCEAHLALGDAATQKGRWKEASQSYQRVLGINEEHSEARQRMAEIHRQRAEKALTDGRDEEALNAFTEALKYAPEDELLAARLEAVKAEKKAKIVAAQVARSEKEASAKNWEAAIRTLEDAQSLAPNDSNIQKRLEEVRGKLRESKLAVLRTKAQSAVKAEKFGEALRTWQEYLSLEPKDREKTEEEISRLQKLVELEVTYNEAQQAISEKRYDQAISLLKQVIVQDENFKDTSRLLTQAIELRRSSRPAPIQLPIAKILRGLLIVIGIAGLGIGGYFAWNQWGDNLVSLVSGGSKVEKVCLISTSTDDARSYWNSQISKFMGDVAKGYGLDSQTFLTQMVKEEYETELTSMIKTEKCDLILGNGTWLKDAFYQFSKEYPKVKFSLIDMPYQESYRPLPENLIEQTFRTFDSGYMAGYLAAGLTETGKVGTFAAEEGTDEMEYMKGFHGGVNDFNQKHGTQVQLFGFNPENGSALFAMGYQLTDENSEKHKSLAKDLIQTEDVDVIFVVSSVEFGYEVVRLAKDLNDTEGRETKIIGTEIDWAAYIQSYENYYNAGVVITSATKDFERMIKDVISRAVENPDNRETIEGNGKNMGVELSPFNESFFTIPEDLKTDFAQFQNETFGTSTIPETALAFVEPIQAYIDTTTPTFEDDFSKVNDSYWGDAKGVPVADFIGDGILSLSLEAGSSTEKISFGSTIWNAANFVLDFDFYFEGSGEGIEWTRLIVSFPSTGSVSNTNCDVIINLESQTGSVGLTDHAPTDTNINAPLRGQWGHLQVVYSGSQVVAFLNGELLGYAEGITKSGEEISIVAVTSGQAKIRLDNLKFWNLDNFASASTPTLDPAIQSALDTIKNKAPVYQTSFNSWEFGDPIGNAEIQGGKLIVKRDPEQDYVIVSNLSSDRYAVEFEFRIPDTTTPEDGCGFVSHNDNVDPSQESWRIIGAGFNSNNHTNLGYRKYPDQWPYLADIKTTFDFSETNEVTLVILGDQITAFINGQLIYSVQNPLGSAIHTRQQLSGGPNGCEFDNYKIWDLRNTITVTSAEDSGPGTLRQALLDAKAGDVIKFDTNVFPPDKPATVYILSELPRISQGNITIDASNSGVILDGTSLSGNNFGLIISSDGNTIMGLQMLNFPGIAIYVEGSSYNVIGGDRTIGAGPMGRGNLVGRSHAGIDLSPGAGGNIITGNLIGTDVSGIESLGNRGAGIAFEGDPPYNPAHNIIGPDNIITHNGELGGIQIDSVQVPVTITANSIYDNDGPGINYNTADAATAPPVVLYFDLASGIVNGSTCKNCAVEIFSTETQDGKIYEGNVTADEYGNFSFNKGEALSGPFLTATTTTPEGKTSEYSLPTSARAAIQIALDAIQNNKPLYQTSFDSWDAGWYSRGDARVENGKLIVSSVNWDGAVVNISNLTSDRYAVEFDVKIEASPEGVCVFENMNQETGKSWRATSAIFLSNGQANYSWSANFDTAPENIVLSYFDVTRTNTVMLIILGDQIAAFINGQIAYTTINPNGSAVYVQQQLSAYGTNGCEFDNYKYWGLSGVNFNP